MAQLGIKPSQELIDAIDITLRSVESREFKPLVLNPCFWQGGLALPTLHPVRRAAGSRDSPSDPEQLQETSGFEGEYLPAGVGNEAAAAGLWALSSAE